VLAALLTIVSNNARGQRMAQMAYQLFVDMERLYVDTLSKACFYELFLSPGCKRLATKLFINPLTTAIHCMIKLYNLLLTIQTTNMKPFLLSFLILFAFACSAQQTDPLGKRDNVFVTTELSKTLGTTALDKKYGVSFVYNRLLAKSHFGVGAGLELIDIRTKRLGGIMPSVDIRYYAPWGRSTLMPMVQMGYNFYRFQYQKLGTTQAYEEKGGLGYSFGIGFGIGYSYNLTEKGSGVYGAFRFRGLKYQYSDPILPRKMTSERLNLSIGWRF
jgi:hypothetical protein